MNINLLFLNLFAVLFAVTVHEVAHGLVAYWGGDPTAKYAGRLTLNPARHLDPIGSFLVPGILALTGAPVFGWAKPVPVRIGLLRNPRRDAVLVSAAGVAANLALALLSGIIARILYNLPVLWSLPILGGLVAEVYNLMVISVMVNCVLFAFNLVPLPPLDGGHILVYLLPPQQGMALERAKPYTMMILLILLMTDILGDILWAVVHPMSRLILGHSLGFVTN
ncbi:MAG: site-2 protease family protein [Thermodesulfobacteriota bacterium]